VEKKRIAKRSLLCETATKVQSLDLKGAFARQAIKLTLFLVMKWNEKVNLSTKLGFVTATEFYTV